jgi:hypothetical protein
VNEKRLDKEHISNSDMAGSCGYLLRPLRPGSGADAMSDGEKKFDWLRTIIDVSLIAVLVALLGKLWGWW